MSAIIPLAMAALCPNDHIWEMAPNGPSSCPRCHSEYSIPVARYLAAMESTVERKEIMKTIREIAKDMPIVREIAKKMRP